jgi:hypothetical protein
MSYTKTLLAGAALCALCSAPALAGAPSVHLATSGFDSPSKMIHSKTHGGNPNNTDVTLTYSFTAQLSASADYHVPIQFIQYTWQNTATCIPPKHENFEIVPRKSATAKISVGTTTGPTSACPSSTFTFYGPLFDLRSMTATADSFTGALEAKKYFRYNYTLNENWAITINP